MKKILFTGGGSAGHVIPNVALMEDILKDGFADVCYMGTDGIEKRLIQERKLPFYEIQCPKLIRSFSLSAIKRNLKIPFELCKAKKQAEEGLKIFQPDLVFSKGGYVALPVILAAKKLKIPCFAHESDFSIGLANKLSAKKCERVFTSFPETAKTLRNGKYSGAPIRNGVLSVSEQVAKKRFSIPENKKVLLVFGGGSGSACINDALRKNLKTLCEKYFILHVCGKGNLVPAHVKNYRQHEFISDMGSAYAAADLVVSRSGSGTVFELLALKKPALFIPLAGQTRGDQMQNAEYFFKKGLCHVLPQNELEKLPQAIDETANDEGLKARLAACTFTSGNQVIISELRSVLGV